MNLLLFLMVGNRLTTSFPGTLIVATQHVAGRLIMTLLTRLPCRVDPVLPALPQMQGLRAGRMNLLTHRRSAALIRVLRWVLCNLVNEAVPVTGELVRVIMVRPMAQQLLENAMILVCLGATETRPTLKLKLPVFGVHDPPNGMTAYAIRLGAKFRFLVIVHVMVDLKFRLPAGLLLMKHGGHVGSLALTASALGPINARPLGV